MINNFVILLFSLVLAVPVANGQEEWVFSAANTKPAGGRKAKPAAPIRIKQKPTALVLKSSVGGEKLLINLSDGKQKFGNSSAIQIRSGENIYMRPRLDVAVSLEDAKAVQEGDPLLVVSFLHSGDEYDVKLVFNSKSELPDTVVTKK